MEIRKIDLDDIDLNETLRSSLAFCLFHIDNENRCRVHIHAKTPLSARQERTIHDAISDSIAKFNDAIMKNNKDEE